MTFTAKDVKALRESTGAGMMDCKKALEETDGDIEAAKQHLREKGLAASAKRDDRDNNQGLVALKVDGNVGAIVKLKSETDFVAGSDQFKAEAEALRRPRRHQGPRCRRRADAELEELKILLKEKIELGEVVRFEAADGNVLERYEHIQGGRGVNGVLVEVSNGTDAAGARHRRAHRLRPPEVPAARRRPRRRGRRRARHARGRSPATRASPTRRSPRSSKAASVASSRTSCCSSSRTPRTTSCRSARCSMAPRS